MKCFASFATAAHVRLHRPRRIVPHLHVFDQSLSQTVIELLLREKIPRRVSSSVIACEEKEKPRRPFQRRGRKLFVNEVTTTERFSSTIRISCRGRLQDLHAARNQDGGPGQLHPLVMRRHSQPTRNAPHCSTRDRPACCFHSSDRCAVRHTFSNSAPAISSAPGRKHSTLACG